MTSTLTTSDSTESNQSSRFEPGRAIPQDVENLWSFMAKRKGKHIAFDKLIPICGKNPLRTRAALNVLKREHSIEEHPEDVYQAIMSADKRNTIKTLEDSLNLTDEFQQHEPEKDKHQPEPAPIAAVQTPASVERQMKRRSSPQPSQEQTIQDQVVDLIQVFPGFIYRDLVQYFPDISPDYACTILGTLHRKGRIQRRRDTNDNKRGITRYFPNGFDIDAWLASEAYQKKRADDLVAVNGEPAKASTIEPEATAPGAIKGTVDAPRAETPVDERQKQHPKRLNLVSLDLRRTSSTRHRETATTTTPPTSEILTLAVQSIVARIREHLTIHDIKILGLATGISFEES